MAVLRHVGLSAFVAADAGGYVRAAIRLASGAARLADFRRALRNRMTASALCDGRG